MPICSVSSRQCYDDGKEFAEQALVFDQAGDIAAAIFYYTEAANVLLTAINVDARFAFWIETVMFCVVCVDVAGFLIIFIQAIVTVNSLQC